MISFVTPQLPSRTNGVVHHACRHSDRRSEEVEISWKLVWTWTTDRRCSNSSFLVASIPPVKSSQLTHMWRWRWDTTHTAGPGMGRAKWTSDSLLRVCSLDQVWTNLGSPSCPLLGVFGWSLFAKQRPPTARRRRRQPWDHRYLLNVATPNTQHPIPKVSLFTESYAIYQCSYFVSFLDGTVSRYVVFVKLSFSFSSFTHPVVTVPWPTLWYFATM